MTRLWKPGGKGGGGRYIEVYTVEERNADVIAAYHAGRSKERSLAEVLVPLPEVQAYQHVGKVQTLSWSLVVGILGFVGLVFALINLT